MQELMSWETCLKEHVKKIDKDEKKAKSLLKMAELRYEFWLNLKFDKKFTSIAVEGYYEIIKELLTALLYLDGLKSDNHECLVSYLNNKYPQLAYEVTAIHQLKSVRNSIDYQGFFVNAEYLEQNKLEFKHIIETLMQTVKEKINSNA